MSRAVFALDARPNVAVYDKSPDIVVFDFGHLPMEKLDAIRGINGKVFSSPCDSWIQAATELVLYFRTNLDRQARRSIVLVGRTIEIEHKDYNEILGQVMAILNLLSISSGYDHTKDHLAALAHA